MSGVLRLGNTGAGTGRSTLEASASNDQTFFLPSAGGTLLTSNTSIPGGTITLDGADLTISNGDVNISTGTLKVFGTTIIGGTTALANSTCTINDDGYIFINRSSGQGLIIQQNGNGSSGDNKIALGVDGSASFAGVNNEIDATGQLTIKKASPYTDPSFRILDRNNGNANGILLYGNGNSEFYGDLNVGGYNGGSTTTSGVLLGPGGGVFSQMTAATAGTGVLFQGMHGTNPTFSVSAAGSLTLKNDITLDRSTAPSDVKISGSDTHAVWLSDGKFILKYDGSASFGNGGFALDSTGTISTNTKSHGHIELDSTGSFTTPAIKLFANTGEIRVKSGGGINFDAYATSGNPSSNLLDDYEEGSWIPTGNNNFNGITNAEGYYTKVGKIVTLNFQFNYTSLDNSGTYSAVAGVPFQPGDYNSATGVEATNCIFGTNKLVLIYVNSNTNILFFETSRPVEGSASTGADFFRGSITYMT